MKRLELHEFLNQLPQAIRRTHLNPRSVERGGNERHVFSLLSGEIKV